MTARDEGADTFAACYDALPCGVLVHAATGPLLYASPPAARLLGRDVAALRTLSPTLLCVELGLLDARGQPLASSELPWERVRATGQPARGVLLSLQPPSGEQVWLQADAAPRAGPDAPAGAVVTTLADVTAIQADRVQREQLRPVEAVLDALPVQIAVLDRAGRIVAVNEGWRRFASMFGRGDHPTEPLGTDYLAVCRAAVGPDAAFAAEAERGLSAVLAGDSSSFTLEYPCDLPTGPHWFFMRVVPLGQSREGVVVAHVDITESRHAQALAAEAEAATVPREERAREDRALEFLSALPGTSVTARMLGLAPLRQYDPGTFAALVERYGELLDLAVEQRTYKVQHDLSDALRGVAERIGFLKGGPRDVIEIHLAALRPRVVGAPEGRAQVYAEESRLAVLELMGRLATYYRQRVGVGGRGTELSPQVPGRGAEP